VHTFVLDDTSVLQVWNRHSIEVRAVDAAGHTSPAQTHQLQSRLPYTWVDSVPRMTQDRDLHIRWTTSPTVTFVAEEMSKHVYGEHQLEIKLDNYDWTPVGVQFEVGPVAVGEHLLRVRRRFAAGFTTPLYVTIAVPVGTRVAL